MEKVQQEEKVIIVGDFNVHHPLWNCDKEDKEGETLLAEVEENNMIVLNVDTITHIGEADRRDSNIDLI